MSIGKILAKKAKKKGICEDWYNQLKKLDDNKKAMMSMYVKGIDFCLSNDFPDNQYIRDNFKGVMEDYGVFLDDNINLVNFKRCVALGTTKGCIEISSYGVSEIFAKHDSELRIIARDNAFVEVDIFDNAIIYVYAQDNAKIHVNKYGGEINISPCQDSKVRITDKNKKTY